MSRRKNFTPLEMVEIGRDIEEVLTIKAKIRQETTQYGTGNLPTPGEDAGEPGRAGDQVAKMVGTSRRNYEKAKAVVDGTGRSPRSKCVRRPRSIRYWPSFTNARELLAARRSGGNTYRCPGFRNAFRRSVSLSDPHQRPPTNSLIVS